MIAACGSATRSNGISGTAVAVVDGQPIMKAEFDRWQKITAKSAASGNASAVVPDPPSYTNCIAQLRKQSKPVKGKRQPTETALLAQCKAQEQQIQTKTVSTLIQNAWVKGEAKQRGISVTDAAVRQQWSITMRQTYPTPAMYSELLATSGMTQADVLYRIRIQLLAQRIEQQVKATAAPVTEAQIASYYNRNRAQFQTTTLAQAKAQIQPLLAQQAAELKMAKFITDFQKRWRSKTNCHAGYIVAFCRNAPTAKISTATAH
jgi:foldase protein PrsA